MHTHEPQWWRQNKTQCSKHKSCADGWDEQIMRLCSHILFSINIVALQIATHHTIWLPQTDVIQSDKVRPDIIRTISLSVTCKKLTQSLLTQSKGPYRDMKWGRNGPNMFCVFIVHYITTFSMYILVQCADDVAIALHAVVGAIDNSTASTRQE